MISKREEPVFVWPDIQLHALFDAIAVFLILIVAFGMVSMLALIAYSKWEERKSYGRTNPCRGNGGGSHECQ